MDAEFGEPTVELGLKLDRYPAPGIFRPWRSPVVRLLAFLAIGKAVVFLAALAVDPSPGLLQSLATQWDSGYYQVIATQGYGPSAPYVFSPVFPALIRAADAVTANAWVSALALINVMSFVFPLLLYRTFGYRTALLAELFPTYVVFTTVPYSDVVALLFLAGSLFLMLRGRVLASSAAVSAAIASFYNLAWLLPSYGVAVVRGRSKRKLFFYALPLLTGAAILVWFRLETGGFLTFFALEAPWSGGLGSPLEQAEYLLCVNGTGSFTCQPWEAAGIFLPPLYWFLRNATFEAFYLVGAFYLLKTKLEHKLFLFAYCLSVIVPLFFLVGTPAMSIPRLLLPAFPVFFSYAALIRGRGPQFAYVVVCYTMVAEISIIQHLALFA